MCYNRLNNVLRFMTIWILSLISTSRQMDFNKTCFICKDQVQVLLLSSPFLNHSAGKQNELGKLLSPSPAKPVWGILG